MTTKELIELADEIKRGMTKEFLKDIKNIREADKLIMKKAISKKEAIIIALDEFLKKKKAEKLIAAYGKIPLKWTKKTLRDYRD